MEFTSENYKQYFDSKKYNSLTPDQRSQLIRFTVNEEGSKRGLSDIHLEFKGVADGWTHGNRGSMGSRDMGDHVRHYMQLNEDVLTRDGSISYSAYKTICHELEHGIQNVRSFDKSVSNNNTEVAEYRANDSHYYQESRALYLAQVMEYKAREAGLQGVKDLIADNYKTTGEWDEAGENFAHELEQAERANDRQIIKELGVHSREELAKTAMYGDSSFSSKQYKNVLKSARESDFEMFERNYGDFFDKKELKKHFENNTFSPNYFESKEFTKIKTDWKFGSQTISAEGDAAFFENVDDDLEINMQADQEFFESHAATSSVDAREDKTFFDKVDQDAFELGQELDEKLEGVAETVDGITQGQKR